MFIKSRGIFFSLSQQIWSFYFRSQKIYLLGISICNRLSWDSDYHLMSGSSIGDSELRSRYLSHAKRALYHLSYITIVLNCRRSFCFSRQTRGYNFFWKSIPCTRFQYSVVFWRKLIKYSMSLTLEMRGIAPRISGSISWRSTIWPTSHGYQISRKFFSISQQLWSFSFRSQKIYLLGISICNRISGDIDFHLISGSSFGDAWHQSPNLSHAKRAL